MPIILTMLVFHQFIHSTIVQISGEMITSSKFNPIHIHYKNIHKINKIQIQIHCNTKENKAHSGHLLGYKHMFLQENYMVQEDATACVTTCVWFMCVDPNK